MLRSTGELLDPFVALEANTPSLSPWLQYHPTQENHSKRIYSMEESRIQHVDFIDSIRGFAILCVFVFHSLYASYGIDTLPWQAWFKGGAVPRSFVLLLPATFGWVGVPIFFVISGFCIHMSFCRQPRLQPFIWRRFFRIYPPYMAYLLFFAYIFPFTRLHFDSPLDLAQLVSHILLLHNFSQATFFGINGSFWSVAVEVQLYMLYLVLIVLIRRYGWGLSLLGIAAIEISLRMAHGVMFTTSGTGLSLGLPIMYWFSWSIGAFVAQLHLNATPIATPPALICFLSITAFGSSIFKPLSGMSFLLFALLTAAIVASLQAGSPAPWIKLCMPVMLRKHLKQVGIWSFSLYLMHQPLLSVVSIAGNHLRIHPFFLFMICMASWFVIVPLSRVSYLFLELPSVALGKYLYPRVFPSPVTADPPLSVAEH